METQGWPLFAARRGGGTVYAVVGWEYRTTESGRRAIGVEVGTELDGAPAVQLGDAVIFTASLNSALIVARGGDAR